MIKVAGYGPKTFGHDALGNRTSKGITGVGSVGYNYNAGTKRLESSNGAESHAYPYDNNGNLLTQDETLEVYQYTPFNMMSAATVTGAKTYYTYDGDGMRARARATRPAFNTSCMAWPVPSAILQEPFRAVGASPRAVQAIRDMTRDSPARVTFA